jgi:branched-chain amino acid transport system ATP-binding protein
MDEPTEGLAPLIVQQVWESIGRLKQEGLAILLVEQNVTMALRLVDRVCVMSKGQVVHSSDPASLRENEAVKSQYLGV